MSVSNLGGQFALDMQGLQRLKQTAVNAPSEGLNAAAEQFEAIFLQMVLKSMRETIPESGLLDSKQTRFYTDMLDKQWAQHLSGSGFGLAEQLINQLEGRGLATGSIQGESLIAGIPRGTPRVLHGGLVTNSSDGSSETTATPTSTRLGDELLLQPRGAYATDDVGASSVNGASDARGDGAGERPLHVSRFMEQLEGPARIASRTTGVPAELILAQAALETGWGKHEIPTADGGNSHNLFGIKAGSQWRGETTDVVTTEYVDGVARKQVDSFRVYDSFEDAFTDYARLIGDNPRYAGVVSASNAHEAARALQTGGYATDPAYADKLIAVMASLGERPAQATLSAQASTSPGANGGFTDRVPTSIF
ncbi:flagellar protein FlgJ [Modicisalibacter muralis]|uniref:Peptidoglycan hydrolase FlgJ n=1 Tax=Modicisalibacter muralis TaxID=119000 RepID=A0A1G9FTR4_9GAMM|nr:flagellar assembly peptidoglycan hydrolase FlgJ [Halomonas muralis]SDK91732.1 flagellar protein FlgJ [Halomonas muralis]